MRERPKSNWLNEDGSLNFHRVGEVPEFPEVIAWDKEFADGCDRLAEGIAVKTGKRHFGRWWLTRTSLGTRIVRPSIDGQSPLMGGVYDIDLDRLNENWVRHMGEKNWLGERGLKDLELAITMLKARKN